ncbi:MAG: hypothetical protein ACAH80_06265 [Alphaproteobacteria bacterium]
MSWVSEAFNWAATPPERPFTLGNEFNRIAGNPEYGGFKFGRAARIIDRALTGIGVAGLIFGTGAAMTAILPGAAVTSGGIVLGLCVVKVAATTVAALTDGVAKVGNALLNKKIGVGPATASPTPKP